ncbi:hypothetical protein GCM10025879_16380 [Leuconostoc litchii]|uniref:Accessory secretory protein Asp4 n=1 Tax=Leuconostoc litchii TaxID=1981069 RepID=A0A6P2CPL9_9LACO|nr:hypothetical protein [Leuconostoc litchii]TYC46160.1 hypothetical protein ESZ47_07980 [Leuconostoc litchii]GMA70392.1 hypothetical protein GCM10025879_16380 [Leuconostoc litchii]
MNDNDVNDKKKITILNNDIQERVRYEKKQIIRPDQKSSIGKVQVVFTIVMGIVVLFGIIYSLLTQLN